MLSVDPGRSCTAAGLLKKGGCRKNQRGEEEEKGQIDASASADRRLLVLFKAEAKVELFELGMCFSYALVGRFCRLLLRRFLLRDCCKLLV